MSQNLSRTVYVFSDGAEHTTARYFERAIGALDGWQCVYLDALFDLALLGSDDILFYVDPAPAWPLGLESLPCLTVAYLIDVHQDLHSRLEMAQFFDAVFIAQKDFVSPFRQMGHRHAHWLPLACDPEIHNADSKIRPYDVGFVGKLGVPGTQRYEILSSVLPKYRTNDYLKYYPPREMAAVYGQSKIVFNASINGDVNMRVFEAMAAGALLVTDRIGNGLSELFEEGTHYIGYSTISEALEKIGCFLQKSAERDRIARAGQRAVLEHHTFDRRWESIRQKSDGAYGQAPARSLSRAVLGELYAAVFVALRQPWRLSQVCRRYGMSGQVALLWLKSWGRWVNARIPLTPNAIKARILRQ
jgi:hypothetical protein